MSYGIPDIRDADGELKGVDYTYDWNGQEVTIKHIPITLSEQKEIEAQGTDIEVDKMVEFIDRKIVKPEPPEDWSLAEVMCYFEGIIEFATGGGGDVMEQARKELERRADDEGN